MARRAGKEEKLPLDKLSKMTYEECERLIRKLAGDDAPPDYLQRQLESARRYITQRDRAETTMRNACKTLNAHILLVAFRTVMQEEQKKERGKDD